MTRSRKRGPPASHGQGDAGAIWNRTANEHFTKGKPEGCEFERCNNDPCIYGKGATTDGDGGMQD